VLQEQSNYLLETQTKLPQQNKNSNCSIVNALFTTCVNVKIVLSQLSAIQTTTNLAIADRSHVSCTHKLEHDKPPPPSYSKRTTVYGLVVDVTFSANIVIQFRNSGVNETFT